jgi:hypothetical protein
MGIAYGVTTNFQATKGIVQDGLVLNLDPAVKESYTSGSTVTDLTANANATLQNQAAYNKANGGCFSLDGTDDYITLGALSNVMSSYSAYSLSAWSRFSSSASNGNTYVLLSSWINANFFVGFYDDQYNNGTFRSYTNDAAGNRYPGVTNYLGTYSTNWVNCIVTADETGSYLYLNNSLVNSITRSPTSAINTNTSLNFYIGNAINTSAYWPGDIGPVQVYNRVLSANEVAQNFNVMRHRFGI